MARRPGTRFANGSKPCPECGEPCCAVAQMCARCRGLLNRRPATPPTIEELRAGSSATSTGCILFGGSLYRNGYGYIRRMSGGKTYRWSAHRVAYEIAYGAIPEGQEIHHKCEVKRCINPAHLEAVTRQEHRGKGGRHIVKPPPPRRSRTP